MGAQSDLGVCGTPVVVKEVLAFRHGEADTGHGKVPTRGGPWHATGGGRMGLLDWLRSKFDPLLQAPRPVYGSARPRPRLTTSCARCCAGGCH